MIPVVLLSGYSNSGKTTIIEKLLKLFTERGLEIATIKHHRGNFDIGENKDSTRHLRAGASSVSLISEEDYIIIKKINKDNGLSEILENIKNVDLILVEGYKNENFPKIEVYRSELGNPRLDKDDQNIIGVVSDDISDEDIPLFKFNEIEKLADFIQKKFLK
ncbi:MAG: molybdopterin-guanine dinucleotide biosynthesis protein B [Andreesenia angusta]|nr:molybdopterin-guanine dinucleotide biosynthesis protein B [Andreesenia angusta]